MRIVAIIAVLAFTMAAVNASAQSTDDLVTASRLKGEMVGRTWARCLRMENANQEKCTSMLQVIHKYELPAASNLLEKTKLPNVNQEQLSKEISRCWKREEYSDFVSCLRDLSDRLDDELSGSRLVK
jgi:hypothetical protein